MKTEELEIGGMSCGHCVMALKKELAKVPGLIVKSVEVGRASVQYDEAETPRAAIAAAIDAAGFIPPA